MVVIAALAVVIGVASTLIAEAILLPESGCSLT